MSASWWIAHVLAMHLSVPEPVTLVRMDLGVPGRCAQMRMAEKDGLITSWEIEYDTKCWNDKPESRAWVLAHELCHGAFDYRKDLTQLSKDEFKFQEARADKCADQIVREHAREK